MTNTSSENTGVHQRIGFIGLGAMGRPICTHILQAGHRVTGFDVNEQALRQLEPSGLKVAGTPADTACEADILVVMVHNATQVDQVLFGENGAARVLARDTTIWLASTVSPDYVEGLARRLQEFSVNLVDGPVSGGATGAKDAALAIIASGDPQAMSVCDTIMKSCAKVIYHVGDTPGMASKIKLINQLLTASHIALTAEALAFGARAGIDPALLLKIIPQSAGTSRQFEKRAPRMAASDHTPHSTIGIFLKDLDIAMDAARQLHFPVPMASMAHQLFTMAAGAGYVKESDTTILKVYEQMGGITVAADEGTTHA